MLVLVGVVAGTLSGLLGVGGGVIMVPALVLLLGVPAAVAKGSSLAVIIPTAMVGTRRNLAQAQRRPPRRRRSSGWPGWRRRSWRRRSRSASTSELSNRLFAGLLLVFVALKLLWDNRRPQAGDGATPDPAP